MCLFTGSSFNSDTSFLSVRTSTQFPNCSHSKGGGHVLKTKRTDKNDLHVFVLHAGLEKSELQPKLEGSKTHKPPHSVAFTRDSSVEPLMAHACL